MKRFLVLASVLLCVSGVVFGQAPDPVAMGDAHAREDAKDYRATGWGALAFGASVVFSPLLGGGGVIIAANVSDPNVDLPTARLSYAQKTFESGEDFVLYRSQYEESMEKPIRQSRSRRAWLGTGIGLGVNIVLISILLSSS